MHPQGPQHKLWVQAGNAHKHYGLEAQSSQLEVGTQIQVGNSSPAPRQPELNNEFGYFRDAWSDVFALRSDTDPPVSLSEVHIFCCLFWLYKTLTKSQNHTPCFSLSLSFFNRYLIFFYKLYSSDNNCVVTVLHPVYYHPTFHYLV